MSASRERKKRVSVEQAAPVQQNNQQKKKLSEGWIFAIVMVLIVAALFAFVLGRGIWKRNQVVLTVGEHEVSVTEFNYFFNSVANSYLTYASYFGSSYGVDPSVPLDQDMVSSSHVSFLNAMAEYGYLSLDTGYLEGHSTGGAGYDVTMAQLLADIAKTQILSCYTTYDVAEENGYELDADCYEEIDAEIENLKSSGKEQGWSLSKTIKNTFGDGCTKDGYYDYLVLTHTASHYLESLDYSAEEVSVRYEESPEDFDVAAFYYYTTKAADYVVEAEDGTTPEATEAEEAKAKEAAEAMEKDFLLDSEEKTVTFQPDYTAEAVKELFGEEAATWMFDEATAMDSVKLFVNEEVYYVIKLVNRDDYALTNIHQIFVGKESTVSELTGAERLTAIDAALESDASEANFKALAEKYTEADTEITVENLTRSSLRNVSTDACTWAMGASAGDYEKFEVSGGTLYLMVSGQSEKTFRHLSVSSILASEWLEAATEAAEADCGYNETVAMYGNVSLAMGSAY